MNTVPLKIGVRLSLLTVIGQLIIDNFGLDISVISKAFKKYDAKFLAAVTAKLTAVYGIINPEKIDGEIELINQNIELQRKTLTPLLQQIEGYITRATGLTITVEAFGLSAVRKSNSAKNVANLISNLQFFLSNVNNNLAALEAEGLSADLVKQITDVLTAIKTALANRIKKEEEKLALIEDNHAVLNDFWNTLVDMCDIGQKTFATAKPSRVDTYVMESIKKRIGIKDKTITFVGTVSQGTTLATKGNIKITPSTGGRTLSVKIKKDGSFSKALHAGTYGVEVLVPGATPLKDTVTITTGQVTEKKYEL